MHIRPMNNMNKKVTSMGLIAIMSMIFVANVVNAPLGALELISMKFPNISTSVVQLLATVPNAVAMVFSFISGLIAGKKMKFKALALLSSILVVISGVIPAAIGGSFAVLMISRVIFGVGFGLMVPLTNTLLMLFYEGDKQAKLLGVSGIVYNVGAVIFSLAGGYAAMAGLPVLWLLQLVGLVSFLLCLFFLPEPEMVEQMEEKSASAPKVKLPGRVILISIVVTLILSALNYISTLNMSTIVIAEGLGDAGMASILVTINTVAGIIFSAVFGFLFAKLGKYTYVFSGVMQIASLILCTFGKNLGVLGVGCFLGGASYMLFYLVVFADFGNTLPLESRSAASGLAMAMTQLSGFATSLFTIALVAITGNEDPRFAIRVAMILTVVIVIVFSVYVARDKTKRIEE